MRLARGILSCCAVVLALALQGCDKTFDADSTRYRTARPERHQRRQNTQTLQHGDRVQIVLYKPEPEAVTEVVDQHGAVTLQYLGAVKVAAMTTAEAEEAIRTAYISKGIYREGAIQVAIVPPVNKFYVQGFVNRPGEMEFTRPVTVLQAISMAGGPTEFAHPRIRRLRRGTLEYTIDIEKVKKHDQADMWVLPGDIIEVPRGIF